jgi:hypothetical protein
MAVDKKYFIRSRGGQIGAPSVSSAQDIDAIIAAIQTDPSRRLILHFHGGLVSADAGMAIAEKLLPLYREAGHPVFFVWESGAWETIRNNILELADEPVFKQLLRKALQYAMGKLGAESGARSIAPGQVDGRKVAKTLDEFIRKPGPDTIPYKGFGPAVTDDVRRSAADQVDENFIRVDLERDDDFKRALAALPDVPASTRGLLTPAGPPVPARTTPFACLASEMFSARPDQRGLVTILKVARVLKDIVVSILRRYSVGRDHGFYATTVEEIVRSFKIFGSGANEWGKALQWNRMKKDCKDAFGADPEVHAGTALLTRLHAALKSGLQVDRVTLVGHSTGAIYICEWLDAAAALFGSSIQFDMIFLAPAVTYARFAKVLKRHEARIRSFRMFNMNDELERSDQVWGGDPALGDTSDWRRFIYPSSLLYLVSGILESKEAEDGTLTDEADMPLLGMQRFFSLSLVYDETRFPEVHAVRSWLARDAKRAVWSLAQNAGPGLNSSCNDHGFFDDEEATRASLKHILTVGF